MINLRNYKQVFFDCDGVILDSNRVKSEAFSTALSGESQILIDEFLQYHKQNGGISRFVKFVYFFKVIKNQSDYQNDLNRVLKKYSELSLQGLMECKEIPYVRDILQLLNDFGIDCYVVSGGEQGEVRSVFKSRKLSSYFKGIYGSPITKGEHLKKISPNVALYFGDAMSDYMAAKYAKIDFIYICGSSEWLDGVDFCESNNVPFFNNFEGVMS